jgi:cyd operon protein YbgE
MRLIESFYALTDKGSLRALSLVLALILTGCFFWQPARFAAHTGGVAVWQGLLLIWAVCAAMVHGLGFRPRLSRWKLFFAPLPALFILVAGLFHYFY